MTETFQKQSGSKTFYWVAWTVIVLCVSGFLYLSHHVAGQESLGFDKKVLYSFREGVNHEDPIGNPIIEKAVVDLSALGSFPVLVITALAALGFLILRKQYRLSFFVFISLAIGIALSSVLKLLYMRPRPELVERLTEVHFYSFPSGHSMSSAVVYLTLGALFAESVTSRGLKIYIMSWASLIVFIVGVSRVYIGVHWPSDVLAGWMAGIAWACLCWVAGRKMHATLMKRKVLP